MEKVMTILYQESGCPAFNISEGVRALEAGDTPVESCIQRCFGNSEISALEESKKTQNKRWIPH